MNCNFNSFLFVLWIFQEETWEKQVFWSMIIMHVLLSLHVTSHFSHIYIHKVHGLTSLVFTLSAVLSDSHCKIHLKTLYMDTNNTSYLCQHANHCKPFQEFVFDNWENFILKMYLKYTCLLQYLTGAELCMYL